MYNEVISVIERYARQVKNSDLSPKDFQLEISKITAMLMAGSIKTYELNGYLKQEYIDSLLESADRIINIGNPRFEI